MTMTTPEPAPKPIARSIIFAVIILGLLAAGFVLAEKFGVIALIVNIDTLIAYMQSLGALGPFIVIGLMILAIVFNPLPSAPIALASGAVYGHLWGAVYIVAGAEIGALIAFMITRLTGYHWLQHFTANKWSLGWAGSQNSLMTMVFVSRLMPFLSFDLISYGAGLTTITFWRFALATFFGLIPASFLLAHFGGEMIEADIQQLSLIILLLGLVIGLPLIYKLLAKRNH
jgi:uncharacterized membrane protein YdjX (TVP38/TMEM64 family)